MATSRRDFLRLIALSSLIGSSPRLLAAEPAPSGYREVETLPNILAPYLQLVGNSGAHWICLPARQVREVLVESWDATNERASLTTQGVSRPIRGTPWSIWYAPVGAEMPYRIVVDGHPYGGVRKIRKPSDAATTKVAFLNDLHDRTGTLALAASRLTKENHDLTVLLGDIFNDPSGKEGADRTFRTLHALATLLRADEVPMLYLPGNHDYRGAFADRVDDLFLAPRLVPSDHNAKGGIGAHDQGWDLRLGPVALVAADTGEDFEKRPELFNVLRERQVPVLSDALTRHTDATWRVFLSHIPLFSDDIWNSEHARRTWTETLVKGKVDVALAGHVHFWKTIPAGKEQVIRFKPSPRDSQPIDRDIRYTPPFTTIIGGGPDPKAATVMLLRATTKSLTVRTLAADDGRELSQLQLSR